jgi:dTDP-4-amino-4,6-dideoxygalactose transaminase
MSAGRESDERRFGRLFANYIGVGFGSPVTNGSAALTTSLEAAGVRYGDEVLVPGLVWVACASAVARVGAIPVFVDIDEETYAMCPDAAADAITPRTTAVLVTHLSSSLADLDAFERITQRHGLVLIEDCSQAHGAVWRGRRVGSFGALAAFSFQSSKLLTAGEGGIVVTDSETLDDQVQQLRADGRRWGAEVGRRGFPELEPGGVRQGHNHCMTELQAAILSEGLKLLDSQNQIRIAAVDYLESRLNDVAGVETVRRRGDNRVDVPTFWHLPVRVLPGTTGGSTAEQVRAEASSELGLFLEPVGAPFHRSPLYRPAKYTRFPSEHVAKLAASAASAANLPGATELAQSCFTIPHHALLAPRPSLDRMIEAFARATRQLR